MTALQPLFEAISNAIHSTQAKFAGHVTKRGRVTVNIEIGRKKDSVTIAVEDNGVGDGRGRYIQAQSGFKGSIEIIGWDALLADARARNEAFFDKAGISGKSYFSRE
jgi:hypothetical protein